jgi:dTDP-4-amino-4,6-dideoxygalactose transaminase
MIPLFKVFMPESVMEPLKETLMSGVMEPLKETLMSGWIGEGEKVVEFEEKLVPWVNNKNVLTTNNGTSAIQLALRLAGVGPGDEVITTPMTCSATNVPILALGAKVVWADIDPWTGNIDSDDVRRKVTPRTQAIMCVDWGGYPCDYDELNDIAHNHGIKLIEDACHAFGSEHGWDKVGGNCDFSCFSFQAIKEITTVDGGLLTCKSDADYERGKLLRWYGIDRTVKTDDLRCEADIKEFGYKFHMNDVAATIGIEQLKHVGGNLTQTRTNASIYNVLLPGKMKYSDDRLSSYWLYTVRVLGRDKFIKHMAELGVQTSKVHVRNDLYTMFEDSKTFLPGVDEFYNSHVCIPVGWWVENPIMIAEEVNAWKGE